MGSFVLYEILARVYNSHLCDIIWVITRFSACIRDYLLCYIIESLPQSSHNSRWMRDSLDFLPSPFRISLFCTFLIYTTMQQRRWRERKGITQFLPLNGIKQWIPLETKWIPREGIYLSAYRMYTYIYIDPHQRIALAMRLANFTPYLHCNPRLIFFYSLSLLRFFLSLSSLPSQFSIFTRATVRPTIYIHTYISVCVCVFTDYVSTANLYRNIVKVPDKVGPRFYHNTSDLVTAIAGQSAVLMCRVLHLGNKTVSLCPLISLALLHYIRTTTLCNANARLCTRQATIVYRCAGSRPLAKLFG